MGSAINIGQNTSSKTVKNLENDQKNIMKRQAEFSDKTMSTRIKAV